MKRTAATLEALERDLWFCQYHLERLNMAQGASDGHHMFGRHVDRPEAIIALCHDCHMKLHNGKIDRQDVIQIQIERGILSDEDIPELEDEKARGNRSRH